MREVIAVDFDGTLSLGKYPEVGPPNEQLIALLKDLMRDSPRPSYVPWTVRQGKELEAAIGWLKKLGLVFDTVDGSPCRKLPATLYVDDRAITPGEFLRLHRSNPG